MSCRALLLTGLILAASGCSCDDARAPGDPAPRDGGAVDAGFDGGPTPADAGLDAGAWDAGRADSGASADAGEVDGGAAPDPAVCAVGLADGCCPLAIIHGGTDPDCPDLGCAMFSQSADVELDPRSNTSHGGVGTAFDGAELWLVWADTENGAGYRYTFERRAVATGTIAAGPTVQRVPSSPYQLMRGVTALALDPKTGAGFWVAPSTIGARFRALFIDADGAPASEVIEVGAVCNPFTVTLGAIWPRADRPYSVGESEDCRGHSEVRVTRVEADRGVTPFTQPSDRAFGGFVAYDGLTHRMHTFAPRLTTGYDEMFYAALDLGAGTFTTPVRVPNPAGGNSNFEMAHVATDGEGFVIVGNVNRYEQFVGIVYQTFVGRWDPAQGWGPITILRPFEAGRRLGEARLVWTGSGYVAATTEVDGDGTSAGLTDQDAPRVELLSLAPDGALRQRWPLQPEGIETLYPNLTWTGDRIAVTWVEQVRDPSSLKQHKLRWLSCP